MFFYKALHKILGIKKQPILRNSTSKDIHDIFEIFLEGADKGHFSSNFKINAPYKYIFVPYKKAFLPIFELYDEDISSNGKICEDLTRFYNSLDQIIKSNIMERKHFLRGEESVSADLFILDDYGEIIGFALVTENTPGSYQEEVEFYMAGIKSSAQGKYYGRGMIDELIIKYKSRAKIYARCLDISLQMFKMLSSRGFQHINTRGEIEGLKMKELVLDFKN